MPAGRPVKFSSAEEMQTLIDLYFLACKARSTGSSAVLDGLSDDELMIVNDIISFAPTVSGLAYTLDMSTETLRAYGEKGEFSATVKKAKQRIEVYLEENLLGSSPAGTIFNVKNNFGWKDKQETELAGADGGPVKTDNVFTVKVVG